MTQDRTTAQTLRGSMSKKGSSRGSRGSRVMTPTRAPMMTKSGKRRKSNPKMGTENLWNTQIIWDKGIPMIAAFDSHQVWEIISRPLVVQFSECQ